MVPAALRRGHVHDQAPVESVERQKRSDERTVAASHAKDMAPENESTMSRHAERTTSWTRQERSRVSALCGRAAQRSDESRLTLGSGFALATTEAVNAARHTRSRPKKRGTDG